MGTAQEDARLFGTLGKNLQSYRALVAARSVKRGTGGRRRGTASNGAVKVSAREFAETAGVPSRTVDRYLAVWDRMAEAGAVPARDELAPGVDVDLPDKETWVKWYREVFPPAPRKARPEPEPEGPGGPTTNPRLAGRGTRVYAVAHTAVEQLPPGLVHDQMDRLLAAMVDMCVDDDPQRAYQRCLHSVMELATAVKGLEVRA